MNLEELKTIDYSAYAILKDNEGNEFETDDFEESTEIDMIVSNFKDSNLYKNDNEIDEDYMENLIKKYESNVIERLISQNYFKLDKNLFCIKKINSYRDDEVIGNLKVEKIVIQDIDYR